MKALRMTRRRLAIAYTPMPKSIWLEPAISVLIPSCTKPRLRKHEHRRNLLLINGHRVQVLEGILETTDRTKLVKSIQNRTVKQSQLRARPPTSSQRRPSLSPTPSRGPSLRSNPLRRRALLSKPQSGAPRTSSTPCPPNPKPDASQNDQQRLPESSPRPKSASPHFRCPTPPAPLPSRPTAPSNARAPPTVRWWSAA